MQVKAADDKQPIISELSLLLARRGLEPRVRQDIERELRNVRAGERAERDAAYEIEFEWGKSPNVMTIHDLRIECEGRVAQIDHLLVDRFFDMWVCESKSFSEGVAINERGEWSTYYGGTQRGMASPIEQNKRHIAVLKDVFRRGLVPLPRCLGITLTPNLYNVVLIANSARITRPPASVAARIEGLDNVVKSEQFIAMMDRVFDKKPVRSAVKIVSAGTIERLARGLASLHRPLQQDWAARFGLQDELARAPSAAEIDTEPVASSGLAVCARCGASVTERVAAFCRTNGDRFDGQILCWDCQKTVPRQSRRAPKR